MRFFSSTVVMMLLFTMAPMVFGDEAVFETGSMTVPSDIQNTMMERDHFVENLGQLSRDDLRYYSMGDLRIGFTDSSLVYALGHAESYSYEIEFVESNDVSPLGFEEDLTKYNFFHGNDETSWVTDASSYQSIIYEDLWDGIDMKFYCKDGNLKYDIIVNPGADVSDIRFIVIGAEISLDPGGSSIEFLTPLGAISDGGLIAYQEDLEVPLSFVIEENTYSFKIEEYDQEKVLVIDPLVRSLSYLGGSWYEYGLDGYDQINGEIIVAGETQSADFPVTPGVIKTTHDGTYSDIFITKFNSDQSDLIFSTFFGGNSGDIFGGLDHDPSGNLYLTGMTYSEDLPTTEGAMNETSNICTVTNEWGEEEQPDAFAIKIDGTGRTLLYSTFIGGRRLEYEPQIAVDPSGCAYISGTTWSKDFPMSNAYDTDFSGESQFFLTKLDAQGSSAEYSTYFGGSDFWGEGSIFDILVDEADQPIIVGYTASSDYPTTSGVYRTSMPPNSRESSFMTRFSSSGLSLDASTFLFGDSNPYCELLVEDGVIFGGYTRDQALPVSANAIQKQISGWSDGFIGKIDISFSAIQHCTYFGGSSSTDYVLDLKEDGSSNIYVGGVTEVLGLDPSPGAIFSKNQGNNDGFFGRLSENLTSYDILSYFGGSGSDEVHWIEPIDHRTLLIAGGTTSSNMPYSENAFDTTLSNNDFFAGRIKINSFVPFPPMNLSIERYDSQVNLSWDGSIHDGNETIENYTVYMSTTNASFEEVGRAKADEELVFIKDFLDNGVKYYFYLTAKNIVGESYPSRIVSAVPAKPPSIPEILSMETWNGTVKLEWDVPSDHGGDRFVYYNLYSGTDPDEMVRIASGLEVNTFEHTGLVNGRTYYYSISAGNSMGEGKLSTRFQAVPLTIPYFPTNLSFERGSEFVHLHWDDPYDDGGDDEIIFNVYMKKALTLDEFEQIGGGTIGKGYNKTGLTNGITYEFKITAVNSRGEGPFSEVLSATPIGIPGEPQDLEAVFSDSRVDLEWSPPKNTGGDLVKGYNVYQKWENDDPTLISSSLTKTYLVLNDLENGGRYEYYVTALNTVYESLPSEVVYGIPIGRPDQPTELTAEFGDARVILSWLEPAYDGGSRITSYEVFMGTKPDDLSKISETTITTHTETGLTNGKTYYFAVRAANELSMGSISGVISITPMTIPDQPAIFYYRAHDSSIELRWNPPAQAVEDLNLTYNIYIGSEGDPFHLLVSDLMDTEYLISDLENGISYSIGVSATNSIGEGFISKTIKLMPVGPPPLPLTLNLTRREGSIDLFWVLPEDQGGSPILEIQIFRWIEGEDPALIDKVAPSPQSYRDLTAETGKNYHYMIKGRSEIGLSPDSNSVAGMRIEEEQGIDIASIAFISIAILMVLIVLIVVLMVVGTRNRKQEMPAYSPPLQMYAPAPPQGYIPPGEIHHDLGPSSQTQEQLGPGKI